MFDFNVNTFWVIATAVLAPAFVGYIAWRNNRKNRVAAASTQFRAIVLRTLVGLYPSPVDWPDDIDAHLRHIFPDLQVAVAEFRPFVPWWQRRSFDDAWFRYRSSTGRKIDIQVYHHYMSFSDQPEPKDTFYMNVSRLLSFAKKT